MGLDMYLYVEKYTGGGYEHVRKTAAEDPNGKAAEEVKFFDGIVGFVGIDATKLKNVNSATVSLTVAYWRKANAIHNWFVQNVQDGEDDCERYYVEREQLQELYSLCQTIREGVTLGKTVTQEGVFGDYEWVEEVTFSDAANNLINAHLQPTSGFFFGSTELDYGYVQDLDNTIDQLGEILRQTEDDPYGYEFYYRSSW